MKLGSLGFVVGGAIAVGILAGGIALIEYRDWRAARATERAAALQIEQRLKSRQELLAAAEREVRARMNLPTGAQIEVRRVTWRGKDVACASVDLFAGFSLPQADRLLFLYAPGDQGSGEALVGPADPDRWKAICATAAT